jgi:hypothetical protein
MPPEGVRLVLSPFFADGHQVNLDSIALTPIDGQMRVESVLPLVGNLPYQPAATCDHVATYAETGEWFSPQGTVAVLIGLAGLLALWAHSENR